MRILTHERLLELLNYDPLTGWFTWKINRPGCLLAGKRAGGEVGPYRAIGIDGVKYSEHRLAWFYVHGQWPNPEADHEDGDGHNNKLRNLREATRLQNCQNTKLPSHNRSGFRGVSKFREGWWAVIYVNKKRKYLGTYKTPEEASAAYEAAAKEFFGEFRRA